MAVILLCEYTTIFLCNLFCGHMSYFLSEGHYTSKSHEYIQGSFLMVVFSFSADKPSFCVVLATCLFVEEESPLLEMAVKFHILS